MKNVATNSPKIRWSARLPLITGFLALILLVAGVGGWSALTVISGAIIAHGQIEVEQSRQIVQHPVGGVVAEINTREGDLVTAGQILIRLDATTLNSELAVIEGQYFELLARRGALEAERDGADDIDFNTELLAAARNSPLIADMVDGQRRLFIARRDNQTRETEQMVERKGQIANQVEGLEAQLIAIETQLDLVTAELTDQQKLLEKGLVQASRVLTLRREIARMQGVRGEILSSKAEAGGRMIEADIGLLRLASNRREEAITRIRDLNYQENELAERRRLTIENLSRLDIRATRVGRRVRTSGSCHPFGRPARRSFDVHRPERPAAGRI